MRRLGFLGVLALAPLARCPSTVPSDGLRITLNNGATGLNVQVVVSGPGTTPRSFDLSIGQVRTTTIPGVAGDVIGFAVSVPRDQSITGTGSCTAGPDMASGSSDIHGQVDLILETSTTVRVVCSGAGQPGGGWQ